MKEEPSAKDSRRTEVQTGARTKTGRGLQKETELRKPQMETMASGKKGIHETKRDH